MEKPVDTIYAVSPKLHVYPEPQNVTLVANRVFAGVLIKRRSSSVRVGLKSNDWCPYEVALLSPPRCDPHPHIPE